MAEYDPKESIAFAAKMIENGVRHVLMRELASNTEIMLDEPVPVFDRVETIVGRIEKEIKEQKEKDPSSSVTINFADSLLDRLTGLRAKRENISVEEAKARISDFDTNRPKFAVRESVRRKKSAFNERAKKFEESEKVVEQVKSESMRLKKKPSRPSLNSLVN